MSKKNVLLMLVGLMVVMVGSANASFVHKFDIAVNATGPLADSTDKSLQTGHGDWKAWRVWGSDKETHDATHQANVGGTGITIGIGAGDGSSSPGTVLDFTTSADDAICNSWVRAGLNGFDDYEDGHPTFSIWLILSGPGLVEGTYEVYGYHNSLGDDQPNLLPKVHVQTSYGGYPDVGGDPNPLNNPLDNFGPDANDADGNGVVVEFNDVNVTVYHVIDDALLDPNVSYVRFFTDGSPVAISYQADVNQTAIINAFIVVQTFDTNEAGRPFPAYQEGRACPDASLHWSLGVDANTHNVYFVMDTNEPNLADEMFIFGDDLDLEPDGDDANWVKTNWTVYDSNVLEDGNNDGNSASAHHSLAAGPGAGILTTVDINTIGARTMRVQLAVKHTTGTEAGDIELDYWNGSSWDYIADLNSVGPNEVWATYTDDVNESEYIRADFKLRIRSDIPSGVEVYVDNLSITNTWPVYSKYLVQSNDVNNWTPPEMLELGKTYYWRVDEVNDVCDASPWRGWLWEFTTDTGKAVNPNPSDNTGFISEAGLTLGWSSSCLVSEDYIYFGTDFDDVNEGDISVRFGPISTTISEYPTGALTYSEKYYWRVEGIGGGDPDGEVWAFQTDGYPLMYFDFEEGVMDANIGNLADANFITDSTGNVTFSIIHDNSVLGESEFRYGEGNPLYNYPGFSGVFIQPEPNDDEEWDEVASSRLMRSCFGPDILDLDGPEYTIEAWVKRELPALNVRDNDLEGTIIRKGGGSYGLGVNDDGSVQFMHRGEHISSKSQTGVVIGVGEWHHIAGVFDAADTNDQMQKLYIDGIVVADNNETLLNPMDDAGSDYVGIGAFLEQEKAGKRIGNYFNGSIDELRLSSQALTANEFLIRGDLGVAWLPVPSHFATEIPNNTVLTWNPGDYAESHDVYFGTGYDEVNDATTATVGGAFIDNRDACSYDPCTLELDTTYYWRIDELDDSNGYRWKGRVWNFTLANYNVIDDFESYISFGTENPIYLTWRNDFDTGVWIELGYEPLPAHRGDQSMEYGYDSDYPDAEKYSESYRNYTSAQNWEEGGVKLLTMFFYGDEDNDANSTEQMYFGIQDSNGTESYSEVRYGDYGEDMDDISLDEWTEWNMVLSDFNATLTDVKKVFLGFGDREAPSPGGSGYVYFDDVRLYLPKCVPMHGPDYDFGPDDGDCVVGFWEIELMGDEWLMRDYNIPPEDLDPPAPSVLHYRFEEGSGSSLADSVGTYNGTYITDVNQGPNDITVHMDVGGMSGNSFHFFENDEPNDGPVASTGGIMIPKALWTENITQEITVSMWLKNVHTDEDPAEGEAYMFEFREWRGEWDGNSPDANERVLAVEQKDEGDELIFHDEGNDVSYDLDWENHTEWVHYSFVRDVNDLRIYVNGLLEEVEDSNVNDMNTPELLYLGVSADRAPFNEEGLHDEFTGNMDDFMIFDYALSDAQAAHLGTQGTGYVPMPPTTMNLSDNEPLGERSVNFRDFAELGLYWLDEELWPY